MRNGVFGSGGRHRMWLGPRSGLSPPEVATLLHRGGAAVHIVDDQEVVYSVRKLDGTIGHFFHLDQVAATHETVGTDQGLGSRIPEPGGHSVCSVTGKDGYEHGTDPSHGEQGNHGFGRHRQKNRNRIASPDPEAEESARQCPNLFTEIAETQLSGLTALLLRTDSESIRGIIGPSVDAGMVDVEQRSGRTMWPRGSLATCRGQFATACRKGGRDNRPPTPRTTPDRRSSVVATPRSPRVPALR